ncbi:MAG TPA: hypothetical protein VMT54_21215, partial [Candidatus Cybelea sp.]|nr:hypothetical protein [Candidatus Cybelea sp.]
MIVLGEEETPAVAMVCSGSNAAERLSHFQTGSWRPLHVAAVYDLQDVENAAAVLRHLRSALAGVHIRGSWYRCAPA